MCWTSALKVIELVFERSKLTLIGEYDNRIEFGYTLVQAGVNWIDIIICIDMKLFWIFQYCHLKQKTEKVLL